MLELELCYDVTSDHPAHVWGAEKDVFQCPGRKPRRQVPFPAPCMMCAGQVYHDPYCKEAK